jgi:hypothetical protein
MRGLIVQSLCVTGFVIGSLATFSVALAAPVPCKLVSQAEAATAMGEAARPGIASAVLNNVSCRYYNTAKTKNVWVRNMSSSQFATSKGFQAGNPVPVSGVGDEAFWMLGSLFIHKGTNYEQVSLFLSTNSMKRMEPNLPALGKLVASHL